MLENSVGCIWSDEWIPGYHIHKVDYWFDVKAFDEEAVSTPAGTFKNCRHVYYHLRGQWGSWSYRGRKKHFWFAPGIGIVKMQADHNCGKIECIWILTDYNGEGEGYFPVSDGLFRKYAPVELGDGYKACVEYTIDVENGDAVIFRNSLGTQKNN